MLISLLSNNCPSCLWFRAFTKFESTCSHLDRRAFLLWLIDISCYVLNISRFNLTSKASPAPKSQTAPKTSFVQKKLFFYSNLTYSELDNVNSSRWATQFAPVMCVLPITASVHFVYHTVRFFLPHLTTNIPTSSYNIHKVQNPI